MPLTATTQYSNHRSKIINMVDEQTQAPIDLTGATIYARMENDRTLERKSVTGTLTVTSAVNGEVTWALSAADVADAGNFHVQFKAAYSNGRPDRSYRVAWPIMASMDSPSASPSASASASPSVSPSVSPSASKSPSASASP